MTTPWSEPSTWTPRHLGVADRLLKLRYPATCVKCGADLPAGARCWWDSETRSATCTACCPPQAPDPSSRPPVAALPDTVQGSPASAAGASAQLVYERKHRRREAEIDQKGGRLSGVVKFLSDDPQSTKAWAKGSEGERKLAAHLVRTLGDRAVMLHDRRIPGSGANIDHLVVAASGIWIIDAKSYKGKVEQRDVGKWLKTDYRLYVNGRDQTKLVGGLARQINAMLKPSGKPTSKSVLRCASSIQSGVWFRMAALHVSSGQNTPPGNTGRYGSHTLVVARHHNTERAVGRGGFDRTSLNHPDHEPLKRDYGRQQRGSMKAPRCDAARVKSWLASPRMLSFWPGHLHLDLTRRPTAHSATCTFRRR
jgi:hypothetical protein